ncbi:hypothetical protein H2201_005440 [Coniosporium apollinis]|uniref:Cytochrome P450 n=1 Tax=Coniosporium apollinis TaxID=61459 RepID=A0ABQ9NU10_9PEZI|nr:hypothetical protein H2201_005440 [Coniosporium apollinis]
MADPPPQLPAGTSSTLRGLSQNLSFHSSPEAFITTKVLEFQRAHPDLINSRAVVRAKILNRNVAIVSSHAQIQQVLRGGGNNEEPAYTASEAYDGLMAPFFPSPNLLLADGMGHVQMREGWEQRMRELPSGLMEVVGEITKAHLGSVAPGAAVDLYDWMKTLGWKILLGTLLGLKAEDPEFAEIEQLQEELLRGQFSLMPVSINTGVWKSPRKKGITAKEKLQKIMAARLEKQAGACPFGHANTVQLEDVANHVLLFTSSLAVKALASLLTAFLLNLFLFPWHDNPSFASSLECTDEEDQARTLRSVLLETERLSPPIVGVMRRSMRENIISSPQGEPDVQIPGGWDVWLYFVGGGRDPVTFGETWDRFVPDRYLDGNAADSMTFGAGPKTCLGRDLIRDLALKVATTLVDLGTRMDGEIERPGVRGWLGWVRNDSIDVQDWAKDMKQLPTQHPAEPVFVRIRSTMGAGS